MIEGKKKQVFKNPAKSFLVRYKGFCNGESERSDVLGSTAASENCDCGDGCIRTGLGLQVYRTDLNKTVTFPNQTLEIKQLFTLGEFSTSGAWVETLGVLTDAWSCFLYNDTAEALSQKLMLRDRAKVFPVSDITQKPWALIVGKIGVLLYNSSLGVEVSDLTDCLDGCVCGDRVFVATAPFTIHYSAPLEYLKFEGVLDESGELYLRANMGDLVEMRAVGKDVYIVYEYGIMRLKTAGATRDFRLERLPYNGGKIFQDSFGVCNGKIFFLASDGVYIFDGERFERGYETLKIAPHQTTQTCSNAAFEGKWLLRFCDEQGDKRLLVLNTDGKRGYYASDFRGLCDWDGRTFCQESAFFCCVSENGVLPSGGVYRFETRETDFGYLGRKNLRSLRFEGEGSMTLAVQSGGEGKSYNVVFVDGEANVRVRMRGERFKMTMTLGSDAVVRNMTAEIERL